MPPIKARKVALPGEEPGAESIRFVKQLIPPLDVDCDSSTNRKSALRSQTAVDDAFGAGKQNQSYFIIHNLYLFRKCLSCCIVRIN